MPTNLPMMLATQVPMIEARAASSIFDGVLRPALAEPDSWRKARQAFAPKTAIENGIGVLEISGVLAYRPDLGDMFFDGFDFAEEGVFAFFATAIFGSMFLGVGSYLLMRWFYYSTAAPGAGRGSSVNAAEDVSKEKRVAYTCSKCGWYQERSGNKQSIKYPSCDRWIHSGKYI